MRTNVEQDYGQHYRAANLEFARIRTLNSPPFRILHRVKSPPLFSATSKRGTPARQQQVQYVLAKSESNLMSDAVGTMEHRIESIGTLTLAVSKSNFWTRDPRTLAGKIGELRCFRILQLSFEASGRRSWARGILELLTILSSNSWNSWNFKVRSVVSRNATNIVYSISRTTTCFAERLFLSADFKLKFKYTCRLFVFFSIFLSSVAHRCSAVPVKK